MDERLAALMRAAQAGDAAAYAELLHAITPHVRRLARRRGRRLPTEDVEDLVQDVLLSVHAVRATYDPDRPFIPWLSAIVRHRLADNARRHARRAGHEVAVEMLPVTFSHVDSNTSVEPYPELHSLRTAIDALPRGQRHAIELVKINELSFKEASTLSGISVGALKVAVHRGIRALRRTLRRT